MKALATPVPLLELLALVTLLGVAWVGLRTRSAQGRWPQLPAWFLPSLDAKDRRLLTWCAAVVVVLAVATGILLPSDESHENPLPSSYSTGQHGALAAYETLVRAGYAIERWERPLPELAATAGPDTVVIFAQPFTREVEPIRAVREYSRQASGAATWPRAHRRTPPRPSALLPASWSRKDWIRWLDRVKCGWCPKPHGRWGNLWTGCNTTARDSRPCWSTLGAAVTWCGGPPQRRWKTGPWGVRTTWTCC
jgi:hypothetical protein